MNRQSKELTQWQAQAATNTRRLGVWTLAWLVSLALATFGPLLIWESGTAPSIIAILVNLACGIGMLLAYRRHLLGLDEMQRLVQLEAMALSLGVGLITGLAFSTLEIAKLIPFKIEIAHMVILMSLTYLAGVLISRQKYA